MSLTSIIFSRDRPAQLDLLLRSMEAHAPAFLTSVYVVTAASDLSFGEGYNILQHERDVSLIHETVSEPFRDIVMNLLARGRSTKVAFFVDDDVIYRPLPIAHPSKWLDLFPGVASFSLRLGTNTTECYPLRARQGTPPLRFIGDFVAWEWNLHTAAHDWAYPGSLDGHIYRRDDLLRWLDGAEFSNPNQLEEALMRGIRREDSELSPLTAMAAFVSSCVVGIPANSVSETHGSNRHGELFAVDPAALNELYLAGRRLSLPVIEGLGQQVNAAHVEMPLLWEDA